MRKVKRRERVTLTAAHDEECSHRLRGEPARDERKHVHCRSIQPVNVVRDDHNGTLVGKGGQELEHGQRHSVQVQPGSLSEAQRRSNRVPFPRRAVVDNVQHVTSSWCSPANGRFVSVGTPLVCRTRQPLSPPFATTWARSAVFPIPAGPVTTRTVPDPVVAASTRPSAAVISPVRPKRGSVFRGDVTARFLADPALHREKALKIPDRVTAPPGNLAPIASPRSRHLARSSPDGELGDFETMLCHRRSTD